MRDIRKTFSLLGNACLPEEKKQAIYKRIKKNLYLENLNKKRNRRIMVKAGSLAGAAAALVLGAAFLPGLFNTNTNIAIATQSPKQSNEIVAVTTPQPRIIYGEGDYIDDSVPSAGTCMLSGGVSRAVGDPSNDGAMFYVSFLIYDPESQAFSETFTYEGKTIKEWGEAPELIDYKEGFNAFSLKKDAETDWSSMKTAEDKERYFQSIAQEWDAIWSETHETNPWTKYKEADQAYLEVKNKRKNSQIENESERLISLGIDVRLEKAPDGNFRMTALLTKEQVLNFPCGDYGYIIMWADKADIIDD